MNWEVRHGERRKPYKENTMNHNWQAGHEPDEIEALREKVAAMTQERDTLNAALDAKITICGDANLAAAQEQVALLRQVLTDYGSHSTSDESTCEVCKALEATK